jgi:4-hydroxy-3-methylbut-2-enyl diphosphate reductase
MTLLVLTPLRIEAAALRVPGARVLRTGLGASHARIAAARALAIDADAIAIAGVCAGVAPELEPGDVVCATELRREDAPAVTVPESGALVAARTRPLAVLRVVADAAGRRLVDPRMLADGTRALRSLRQVSPALADWAAAIARQESGVVPPTPPRSRQTAGR